MQISQEQKKSFYHGIKTSFHHFERVFIFWLPDLSQTLAVHYINSSGTSMLILIFFRANQSIA